MPHGEVLAAVEQAAVGDPVRNRPIVEEQRDLPAGRQVADVRHARIEVALVDIPPAAAAGEPPGPLGLARRQDREPDPMLGQNLQRGQIDRRLGQPHPFRIPLEPHLEVFDAPDHLRVLVVGVRQGHDHVVVRLGHRTAVAGELLPAAPIGLQDHLVDVRGVRFQPVHERRAEIEADALVVVDDIDDPPVGPQNPRTGVLPVALLRDSRIPVVIRIGRILQLDVFEPRVLPRRLIKMSVNTNVFIHPATFLSCSRQDRAGTPLYDLCFWIVDLVSLTRPDRLRKSCLPIVSQTSSTTNPKSPTLATPKPQHFCHYHVEPMMI